MNDNKFGKYTQCQIYLGRWEKERKKPKDSQGKMCWYFVAVSVESNYCKEDCPHKRCLSRERNQTQNSIIIFLFTPVMCVGLYWPKGVTKDDGIYDIYVWVLRSIGGLYWKGKGLHENEDEWHKVFFFGQNLLVIVYDKVKGRKFQEITYYRINLEISFFFLFSGKGTFKPWNLGYL